ncbi:hypothetical protein MTAT_16630 [Moorella thermoacetica]|uniref:Type IV leader peptidase family protein n=1 Tax=Neomoorella thermoacetica TaxID=1525 RepID=A0AAC9HGA5_NEOTH|nr:prepilin peptidase [Moorella thermoacetica]AOQ23133.1 Type IV leader peptidase family protein [Moorella thermoacetica]TYL12840.1 hypothetical protein MTAT_16630 [Moorella thermoacetica]
MIEKVVWSILLLAPVAGAAYTDGKRRIIPNWLNLLIFCLGLSWQTSRHEPLAAFSGSAVGLALGLVPALFLGFRGIGGGDLKMMAALGAWYGSRGVLTVVFLGALAAAAGGLAALARAGKLRLWLYSLPVKGRERSPEEEVPFGAYLAAAVFAVEIFKLLIPNFWM